MHLPTLLRLLPVYFAASVDLFLTVIYQPARYWQGELSLAREGNFIVAYLMRSHLAGLFLAAGLWFVLLGLLGYWLKAKINSQFFLLLVLLHSYGAVTWIKPNMGFYPALAFMIFNAAFFAYCYDVSKHLETPA